MMQIAMLWLTDASERQGSQSNNIRCASATAAWQTSADKTSLIRRLSRTLLVTTSSAAAQWTLVICYTAFPLEPQITKSCASWSYVTWFCGCHVLSKWVWRCCAQPFLKTIIVAFLWLSVISSNIVFEVKACKYKAVAQLIQTLPVDCWIHSFMIARRMSQPAATDQGVRSV